MCFASEGLRRNRAGGEQTSVYQLYTEVRVVCFLESLKFFTCMISSFSKCLMSCYIAVSLDG